MYQAEMQGKQAHSLDILIYPIYTNFLSLCMGGVCNYIII